MRLVRKSVAIGLLAAVVVAPFHSNTAQAIDTSPENYINGKYYTHLIPDGELIAKDSMSVSDIQSFLVSKGSYLAVAPSSLLGDNNEGRSAAQIIWDAAHGYNEASGTFNGIVINTTTGTISPRVILATLQKEQSLVTRTTLNQRALDCAMGYEGGQGCQSMFDNKPNWKGFTNQVEWGAWQLRYNYEIAAKDSTWWDTYYSWAHPYYYYVGNTLSFGDSTGVYSVPFTNRDTATFYRYTPHVFNGNYNLWKNMVEWFGVIGNPGGGSSNSNDVSTIIVATYRSSFKVSGTKQTNVLAYFQDKLIANTGGTTWEHTFTPTSGNNNYTIEYRNTGNGVVATKVITIDKRKAGDVNGDGRVELLDVSIMSGAWGQNVKEDAWINLNPEVDSIVDLLDLSLLASNYEG